MERVGRVKHPTLGPCVTVKVRHWEGPDRPSGKGREVWQTLLFPRDQFEHAQGPARAPVGFNEVGDRVLVISGSVSYRSELDRYGNFRWHNKAAD
jgi:hypothetical protein